MPAVGNELQLLTHQYRDEGNLLARVALHGFGTNNVPWPQWVFDRLALEPGMTILEAGCGPGLLWSTNSERVPSEGRTILTDLSAGMLTAARRSLPSGPFQFAETDVQSLPFRDHAFDLVIANHMLYHVPDVAEAVREIRRVLRRGGRVCAATNGREHLRAIDELAKECIPAYGVGSPAERFGLENGRDVLSAQFEHVAVQRYENVLAITDADAVVAYVRSISPESADIDGLNLLKQRVAARLAADGTFSVRTDAGLFIAS